MLDATKFQFIYFLSDLIGRDNNDNKMSPRYYIHINVWWTQGDLGGRCTHGVWIISKCSTAQPITLSLRNISCSVPCDNTTALLRFHFLIFHGMTMAWKVRVTCLPAIVHRRNHGD